MQIQEPQLGHASQALPGEGDQVVPIQPQLLQTTKALEGDAAEAAQGVIGHPEVLQVVEQVESLSWHPADGCLFYPKLACINRDVHRREGHLWVIAQHCPGGERQG